MNVDLFDFELPDSRIALRPASPRDSARMLVVEPRRVLDHRIADLAGFLRPGDVVVANDTKVIPARLVGVRIRDGNQARMTVTLHKREGLDRWRAFVKPAKKLHLNETVLFDPDQTGDGLSAHAVEKADGGEVVFVFNRSGAALDNAIAEWGSMPLPPYIATHRAEDDADRHDYQTLFATHEGAVAAPTAGLHFTPDVKAAIERCGASVITVTLHVGAGTFLPVKAGDTADHRMHSEWGSLTCEAADILNDCRKRGGRIVAVGTTSLRVLETAAKPDGSFEAWQGDTAIFITPGYRFKAVDLLFTNFHLPRSTLFMLVSAFCGLERMQAVYRYAIEQNYRFYSYGDACLLYRAAHDARGGDALSENPS